jgi:hypothetical protein
MRRNYVRLEAQLLSAIEREYPTDKSLAAAREYSTWLHNQFTRGPVGAFFGRGKRDATFLSDPERDALRMLNREKASRQMVEASAGLNRPSLIARGRAFVQAEIAQIAEDQGPKEAHKFMSKVSTRRFMEGFPKAYAELQEATTALGEALTRQAEIGRSAFYKFAERDPQEAVKSLLEGSNKVTRAREIKARLSEDESGEALQALQDGMVQELFRKSGFDPTAIEALIGKPSKAGSNDMKELFSEVLGAEKMARLTRMVNSSAALQRGEHGVILSKAQSMLARFIGAGAIRATGASTIQQTAAGASFADLIYKSITSRPPPHVLLARAVLDPRAERYLFSQVPSNIKEMRQEADLVRAMIVGIDGIQNITEQVYGDE